MSRALGRALFVVTACFASAFAGPQRASAVAIQGSFDNVATRIAVKLDDRLSSQDNRTGDVFTFELTGSVIVDGVAIGAGTRGHGVVTAVHSGEGPRRGFIDLDARSLDLPNGAHVSVGLAPGSLDRRLTRESRGFSMPLGGAVPVYVGPSRDNNVVYEKGTAFTVIAPPPATPEPDPSTSP